MFVEKKRGQGFVLALSLYPSEERAVPNGSISIKPRINRILLSAQSRSAVKRYEIVLLDLS